MKKKILFLVLAVMVLAAGLGGGYWIATGTAPDAEKPEWQVVVEQRVAPLVISAISTVLAWWVANRPAIAAMHAAAAQASLSATGFDGAAGGIASVRAAAEANAAEVQAARAEIAELKGMLLTALKMIGLGFSHEEELVKNGAAREIMRMEEPYEGKK